LLQLAALCVAVLLAAAQAGAAEYRGDVDLSEITDDEWGMIRDAEMPREKIRQVLNHNVTITEYFRYPWLRLGMSEKQYLEARRQGRLTRDNPDLRRSSESQHQWAVVHNFFLPGLHQFKRGQNQKAGMMAGGAVLGAGLFALALTRDYGDIAPLSLLIMIPSMAWSSVDIGMQIHREQNPEASRFSAADTESTSHAVSLRFSVPWR
jgi:hypothetical protein